MAPKVVSIKVFGRVFGFLGMSGHVLRLYLQAGYAVCISLSFFQCVSIARTMYQEVSFGCTSFICRYQSTFFFEGVPFSPRRNVVPGLALLDILEEVVDVQVLVVVQVPGEVDSHISI